MKRILILLLSLSIFTLFFSCSKEKEAEVVKPEKEAAAIKVIGDTEVPALSSDGPTFNLTMATSAPEMSSAYTVMKNFKDLLESASDGKMTVDLYAGGQLGNDSELIASCLAGNISMIYQSGSTHSTIIPQSAIFDTPFLFAGYDTKKIENVIIKSPFRDLLNSYYEKKGFKLLTVKIVDSMNLSSNKPVYNLNDLKGLKVRTPQSEARMLFWRSLGANPTPLSFGELYMGLQQGLVDACENAYAVFVVAKLAEQQKYLISTNHMMPSMELMINKDLYDSFPVEYQNIIELVSVENTHFDFNISREEQDGFHKQLIDEFGLIECEVSDDFRNNMVKASQESILLTKSIVDDPDLYEKLLEGLK